MSTDSVGELNSRLRELVDKQDKNGIDFAVYLKKLHDRLAKFKKTFTGRSIASKDVAKLITDLKSLGAEPELALTSQNAIALSFETDGRDQGCNVLTYFASFLFDRR